MTASAIGWSVGVLFSLGLVCGGCGGNATTSKGSIATVCDPGGERCAGDSIKLCNLTGTADTTTLTCAPGQCRAQGSRVYCLAPSTPTTCTPNQAVCNGDIAAQCKVDGSGPLPGGVDCGRTNQHCLQGACSDALCISGTKSCHDGDVYLCSMDGSSLSLLDICTASELCDEVSGTCLTQRCEPSKATCQGTRAVTCNASGSDWLPASTDCAAQGKVCVAGGCEKKSCAPATTFCQDGNIQQCDSGGASSTLSKACRPGFDHCELTAAGSYACVADTCVAGQRLCEGNVLKTCNADGSRPKEGTVCGKGEVCENAQCKVLGCSQGTVFCQGKDIYRCEPDGPKLYSSCDADVGRTCVAIISEPEPSPEIDYGLAECVRQPCPAGEAGCLHNQLGTCAADGLRLSAVSKDCALSGQVCTAATDCTLNEDTGQIACATPPTCAASVTDTLARAAHAQAFSGNPYLGNVFDVISARKLTELQMLLKFQSPRDLRWIVFEQVGSQLVARAEKTTSATSSDGFVSSGVQSFSYQLEAGKRYALGVILPSGSVSYNVTAEDLPDTNVSFGSALGSVMVDAADLSSFSLPQNFATTTLSHMKVTTESL